MPEQKISVVIHTLNSERFLERVLKSVQGFDEVLICDMHSDDNTLQIARQYGCSILMHERLRFADPARNTAIQAARHDWVLVVDSDELVKPALRDYLYSLIRSDNPPVAVRISVENYFMGRFMRGEYPNYVARFFRKDSVYWPPFVHRQPTFDHGVVTIPRRRRDMALIHLENRTMYQRIAKNNTYSDLEVERRGARPISILEMSLRSYHRFFKSFILKGGFRDGIRGYIYARLQGQYKFVALAKQHEASLKPESVDPVLRG